MLGCEEVCVGLGVWGDGCLNAKDVLLYLKVSCCVLMCHC